MSYAPTTDFLGLLRLTSNGVRSERVPGLDFAVSALARAGLINLSVSQTAPAVNQQTTAWFQPAVPTWTAEGVLYLWNLLTARYEVATPALWAAFLAPSATKYVFQSVNSGVGVALPGTTLLAVQRVGPATTSITLPNLAAQWLSGSKLQVVDFSTGVTSHVIALTTPDAATIMQKSSWALRSTADSLAGVMLQPSPDLNSWIIAP